MAYRSFFPALALACASLVASRGALAKPPVNDAARASARKLAEDGVEAYQNGNYAVATEKLERAFQALPVPSIGLWSARALEKSGKLVEASERLLATTRLESQGGEVAVQQEARANAATERQALLPRLPNLTLDLQGADAASVECTLDGESVPSSLVGEPQPVNPGPHVAECRRGAERVTASATLNERENKSVALRFTASSATDAATPANPTAPSADSTPKGTSPSAAATLDQGSPGPGALPWIIGGVGVAALGAGAAFGMLALSSNEEAEKLCSDPTNCNDTKGIEAAERRDLQANISNVGIGVGVVGIGVAVVMLVAGSKSEPSGTAVRGNLLIGPGSMMLTAGGRL